MAKRKPKVIEEDEYEYEYEEVDVPWWRPTLGVVASTLVIALMCFGIFRGLPSLELATSHRLATDGVIPMIDWPAAPQANNAAGPTQAGTQSTPQTWMLAEHREHLMGIVVQTIRNHADRHTYDPLDAALLADISATLDNTGWFLQPPNVVREETGKIRISGRWRAPAAVVRWQGRDHLVSLTGELLPYTYDPGASPFHGILGVSQPMPTQQNGSLAYGTRWQSPELTSSLQLLIRLQPMAFFHQIIGVEASNFGRGKDRGQLVLLTDAGNRVVWGVPTDVNGAPVGQRPSAEKIQTLQFLFDESGRIDRSLPEINIGQMQPTVRNGSRP